MGSVVVAFLLAGAICLIGLGIMVFFWGVEHEEEDDELMFVIVKPPRPATVLPFVAPVIGEPTLEAPWTVAPHQIGQDGTEIRH